MGNPAFLLSPVTESFYERALRLNVDMSFYLKIEDDLDVDTSYQYLTFFLDDDAKLKEIGEKYSKGEMLTSEIKEILIDVLVPIIMNFQKNRKLVTDEIVDTFLAVRPLQF